MKPAFLVLICVLVASLSGAGTAFLLMENQHDADAMGDESRDLDADSVSAQARILALEGKLEEMTRQRRESPVLDIAALKELDRRYGKEVADLKSAVSRLSSRTAGDGELLASVGGESTVEDVLSRYVEEAVAKKEAQRRKTERKRWTPFVKARMEKQLEKTIKKLGLRPDQAERFESSVRESMETLMPAFGIVMDPGAKKDEKVGAFGRIDDAMKRVDNDAQGYMDPSQYETFTKEQEKQNKQMNQMRTMFGGNNGGGANGSNPTSN